MPAEAKFFPEAVREALQAVGACITCLPVQFDRGEWETAIFFVLEGRESEADRARLTAARTVPLALDTDVIEHPNAAVAVIRLEVLLDETNPLAGEMLLTPGGNRQHFETMDLLTRQPRLGCFIGDPSGRVLLSQFLTLGDDEHAAFRELLGETTRHDAVVRMTNRYDAHSAFREVTSNYAHRHETVKR